VNKIDPSTLSDVEALEHGAELWGWLAETGKGDKAAWPGWEKFTRYAEACCFLCEFAEENALECGQCLLHWRDGGVNPLLEPCANGEFGVWSGCNSRSQRRAAARVIADMHLAKLKELKGAKD
jgi:hypothetical protein